MTMSTASSLKQQRETELSLALDALFISDGDVLGVITLKDEEGDLITIRSLRELELNKTYFTQNSNPISRTAHDRVVLGEGEGHVIDLEPLHEDNSDPDLETARVLPKHCILCLDRGVSRRSSAIYARSSSLMRHAGGNADREFERVCQVSLRDGFQVYSDPECRREGRVIFSLSELEVDHMYFSSEGNLQIAHTKTGIEVINRGTPDARPRVHTLTDSSRPPSLASLVTDIRRDSIEPATRHTQWIGTLCKQYQSASEAIEGFTFGSLHVGIVIIRHSTGAAEIIHHPLDLERDKLYTTACGHGRIYRDSNVAAVGPSAREVGSLNINDVSFPILSPVEEVREEDLAGPCPNNHSRLDSSHSHDDSDDSMPLGLRSSGSASKVTMANKTLEAIRNLRSIETPVASDAESTPRDGSRSDGSSTFHHRVLQKSSSRYLHNAPRSLRSTSNLSTSSIQAPTPIMTPNTRRRIKEDRLQSTMDCYMKHYQTLLDPAPTPPRVGSAADIASGDTEDEDEDGKEMGAS